MIVALQTLIFFRESIATVLDRWFRPYYRNFNFFSTLKAEDSEDEESEDQVFAEYDEEKGVVFYPPMYAQRYAAVSDCLMDERWSGELEKVVDLGYHDMTFIKYLKEVPGVKTILGVDIESIPSRCSSDLLWDDYVPKRENPLQISLFQGNAADPDYRLIGCDAVVSIEMIEHMLPFDLDRLVHTVFGFIRPRIAVFTTPNGDFNELFKSLEKNGLRRLDHFFEWSREQFNEWCSNIVVRYPEYTVQCRGIGPGPEGTSHLGCCSQLALFVSKDYHKQPNLDLNCLTLMAAAPNPNDIDGMIGGLESSENLLDKNAHADQAESLSQLLRSEQQSYMTIILSPPDSTEDLGNCDKMSQCDLDNEAGRDYLMFDDEQLLNHVVRPRRKIDYRVYEMEDVSRRLNCTTLQVKKFSKTTQKLMAKNKIDSLVHTREVVDKIKHLVKLLNFNKNSNEQFQNTSLWNYINWGENAPYWNQYYKIVKEYNYPFEVKSEDCRILDLISDEINRLVDRQLDEEVAFGANRLEIPVQYLMRVVEHITKDDDRVKELLEWNGYQVVNDVVVHTRLIADQVSDGAEEEWPENEPCPDWDGITSEVNSVSNTETSNIVVDNQDRALRRAIDAKVQKLRSTLTADADITLELDRVVCRLMKLALRTSRGKQAPPPSRWMQCKLYDLLTLTERAIERRRLHFIQNFHVGSLDDSEVTTKYSALHNSDRDAFVNKILAEYDNIFNKPREDEPDLELENIDIYEDREMNSSKYDFNFRGYKPQSIDLPMIDTDNEKVESQVKVVLESNPLERIQAWVNEKVEPDAYRFDSNSGIISSGDTDHLSKKETRTKYKKLLKKHKGRKNICSKTTLWKSQSKVNNCKNKKKNSSTKFGSSPKETKTAKITDNLTPVPHDTEKVSQSETLTDSIIDKDTDYTDDSKAVLVKKLIERGSCENNCPVDTVTEMNEQTFSPAETTSIAEANQDLSENETLVDIDVRRSPIKHNVSTEIMHTEPLFLYDPNEPTTSKGIRHTSTDVQCGPEPVANLERTSVSPADVADLSNMKIQESMINVMDMSKNSVEFGTCTRDIIDNIGTITPRQLSTGIKIKDSLPCVETNENSAVILNREGGDDEIEAKSLKDVSMPLNTSSETKLLKAVSSALNVDSISEACSTVESSKSPVRRKNSTNPGNKGIEFDQRSMSPPKLLTKLSCGGVHIHSYKDRQVLQDVVYQGTWQRCKHFEKGNGKVASSIRSVIPVALAKKSVKKPVHDETISKKTLERGAKLKNVQAKQVAPPTSLTRNKTPVGDANHNVNLTKTKTKECKYIPLKKTKLSNQNLKKVASKIRSMACKRSKTALVYKGTAKPAGILKNNVESKPKMKSRIPMRKKITTFDLKKNTLPDVINIIENTKDHKNSTKYSNLNSDDIHPVNYIVFRNEIITKSSDVESSTPIDTHTPRNDSTKQQNASVTNSSCSSPAESVATVKAAASIHTSSKKNINNSQHSGPKSVAGSHGAGPSANTRFKRQHGKEINKHNASQSSTDSCKSVTRPVTPRPQYTGRKKNVVVAQISTSKSGQRTKTFNPKTVKTCLKAPVTIKSNEPPTDAPNATSAKIIKADTKTVSDPQNIKSSNVAEIVDNPPRPLDETLKPEYAEGRNLSNPDVCSHVRDILEDVCDNIHNVGSNVTVINYTDVTKNMDNPTTADNDQTASEQDLKANDNISNNHEGFLQLQGHSADNSLCRTFDNLGNESVVSLSDTIHTLTDNDLVSFKSMTSYSKISEYFLADTSLNEDDFHENSVKNIFERVNGIVDESSKPPGPLAAQAFSGFSMAVGSTTGDQANFVTLVDSETGSVAVVIKRQAESEEMFVSGRSSGTFASCVLDEDSVVPDWLFDLMSQHHTLDDDEEPTVRGVMPAESVLPPFEDSMYEMNGPAEGPRVAGRDAGAAGDGRGVHSDFSQNSDSNTSETTTSDESGVLSEAIVIDPSAFTSQVDAYRNISSTSTVPPTSSELAAQNTETPAENNRPAPNPTHRLVLPTSSGFEADVSSLECDTIDLSDN